MISWRIKKQHTVPLFSIEAKYRAMATTLNEFAWLKNHFRT
jgi:hypothetical protein